MSRRVMLSVLLAGLTTASCTLGPDWKRPEATVPDVWREATASGPSLAETEWFDVYGDPVLQDLVRVALERNQDVRIAASRVEEAAARLGISRAELWPSFGYEVGASRTDPSDAIPPTPGSAFNDYFASAGVSWEIDLWGKLRRANESDRATLLASEEARRAVTITLVGDVAALYFQILDLDEELAIATRTLEGRRQSTALIRSRFEGGITSELDVRQAEIEEATAAAAVPAIERSRRQTENALNVLLGGLPADVPRGSGPGPAPETVPAGLPSDLLERRPDVLAAEHQAHAALAEVGVAEALRFPSLSLTGFLGVESGELSDLTSGDAFTWGLGGSLLGPIFEFGKNKRRVEVAQARAEQAALSWEKAVLNAFREVEDALVELRTSRAEREARARQVQSGAAAARLSRARYDGGVTNYLEVLDIERSLFQAEIDSVRALTQTRLAYVKLYRSLGGGWEEPEAAEE